MPDPKKKLGQRAAHCYKCDSCDAWMNRIGGIECYQCSPPRKPEDCLMRYRSENGAWADASATTGHELVDEIGGMVVSQDAATRGLHFTHLNKPEVRRGGMLTALEQEIFASDFIWEQKTEQWIVFGKPRATLAKTDVQNIAAKMVADQLKNQLMRDMFGDSDPSVGDEIDLVNAIATFRGKIKPGSVNISRVGRDSFGNTIVSLEREGHLLVDGLTWPIN